MQFIVRDETQMKRMVEELLPPYEQPATTSFFSSFEFWTKDMVRCEKANELFRELYTYPYYDSATGSVPLAFNRVNMIAQHKCGTAYLLSDYGARDYNNRIEKLRLYKLLKRVLFMYRSGELKGDFVIHKTKTSRGPQNIAQWPVKMKAYGGYEYWFITGHIQWIMQMKTQLAMKDRELDPKKFNSWLKTRKVADSKIHQLRKSSADEFSRFMTRVDYVRILKELFEPDEWTDYIVDTEMPRFGVLLYRNGKSYATFMGDYQTQHNINVNGNRKLDKFPTYLRKRAPKLDVNHPKNMGLFDYWSAPITIEWEDSSED